MFEIKHIGIIPEIEGKKGEGNCNLWAHGGAITNR